MKNVDSLRSINTLMLICISNKAEREIFSALSDLDCHPNVTSNHFAFVVKHGKTERVVLCAQECLIRQPDVTIAQLQDVAVNGMTEGVALDAVSHIFTNHKAGPYCLMPAIFHGKTVKVSLEAVRYLSYYPSTGVALFKHIATTVKEKAVAIKSIEKMRTPGALYDDFTDIARVVSNPEVKSAALRVQGLMWVKCLW